jgi:GNAT superfamily N-acetyltransferase
MTYQISFEADARAEDIEILIDGLKSFNHTKIADRHREQLTFFLRDAAGSIVGGVHGNSGWGWLYINILWVSETVRGSGYGTLLMRAAEREAARRDCRNIYLDTFSFQAVDFYLKLGYQIFGELQDFPPGHRRVFFRKTLPDQK